MQVNSLPAAAGRQWVMQGFSLLRRQPVAMMAITFLYLLILVMVTVVPIVGSFAPLLLTPVLSVGLMQAVRATDQGALPTPQMLFSGLMPAARASWRAMLVLGVVNAITTVLALGISSLADGGALIRLASGTSRPADIAANDMSLVYASMVFIVVYTPLQMALWYAPVLSAWHGVEPAKAMFFSLAAVMRNKWAFFQFGFTWFAVAVAASIIAQVAKAVVGASPLLLSLLLWPIMLLGLTALYCSFWPTYRDALGPRSPMAGSLP